MNKYLGVKVVVAEPCFGRHNKCVPENSEFNGEEIEGYKVVYEDGYTSWSPKDVFEKAYRPITGMTFGLAIEALKLGKKVTRAGWNGKGMYLWLKEAQVVKLPWVRDQNLAEAIQDNGFVTAIDENNPEPGNTKAILALGTICMLTHDSSGRKAVLTGWLASQTDILAEDWIILD